MTSCHQSSLDVEAALKIGKLVLGGGILPVQKLSVVGFCAINGYLHNFPLWERSPRCLQGESEPWGVEKIRVVSVGLGPIGMAAAKLALSKSSLQVVGAVDPDPKKTGQDLGKLLGQEPNGIIVSSDAAKLYSELRPDVILHCTSSFLPRVKEQLIQALDAGVNIVSSTEELLMPYHSDPELARALDKKAKEVNATLLGTGVNPGYAMDFLAVVASAVCFEVNGVKCRRVVDAGTRRLPLQRKVGAGLTVEEFKAREAAGGFGHIGMEESVALVGRTLGLELERIEQSLEAVVASQEFQTPFLTVGRGQVAGIRNIGRGWKNGTSLVELDLTMAVGSENPGDTIEIVGEPPIKMHFEGGIPGDQATAAILVNSLQGVVEAGSGLKTVVDLPPARIAR